MGGRHPQPSAGPRAGPPRVIGLTGGIGSGKSTVAGILRELGAEVVDADRLGHDCYAPGTVGWRRVVDTFGPQVIAENGSIDRRKLASIVFADPRRLRQLEAIVHPLIARRIRQLAARARGDPESPPLVVEAAVLLEAGWDRFVDEVWTVTAPLRAAVARAAGARRLDPGEVRRRIAAQLADTERRRRADVVIRNAGTLAELKDRVRRLWAQRVVPSAGESR